MTGRGGGSQELSTDQVLLIIVGSIAVSVLIAKRGRLLAGVGGWLRGRHLLVEGPALVTIPVVGGLDLGRVLIVAGVVLITVVACRVVRRAVVRGRAER